MTAIIALSFGLALGSLVGFGLGCDFQRHRTHKAVREAAKQALNELRSEAESLTLLVDAFADPNDWHEETWQ